MVIKDVLSVSSATAIIADRLGDLPKMTIEGEVSNFRPPNTSGHLYFSLGDATSKLNAAFFLYRQREQGNVPTFQNGDKIRATGHISVYAPRGSYHLNVEKIERCDGVGDLLVKFEKLKRQLFEEGLCEASRKRPLPMLPKRIGVVTAPTGAAVRDILNVLSRRFPNLHIIIAPCRVQGTEATEEIAAAIELLNRHFAPDTSAEPMDAMIVGRGGGSFEELWCFNEERVARAVAASKIPVISAVGHEPDIAITDFVADVRAPTPSAAAELICGRKEDFERRLYDVKERLIKALRTSFMEARNRVRYYANSSLCRDPQLLLERYAQQIDALEDRLTFAQARLIAEARQKLSTAQVRLEHCGADLFVQARQHLATSATRLDAALHAALSKQQQHLASQQATLKALDPTAVLSRGYALVSDASGAIVTDAQTVSPGDQLQIKFSTSQISATVADNSADSSR